MKLANLIGERFKERPADCAADSHALMVRGGYLKYVANGIYSQYPPLRRVCRKIEQIIREEMDRIGGQEVQFPVVLPASLWEESGRYESVGSELMRLTDRNGAKLVLGMTHEEAAVQLVREYGNSYQKYPFLIYQIQTKFRDEARPRAGLIRVREFTMKDAYSFHTSKKDLEIWYEKCHKAYERIFARAGIPEVVSVKSDSGMMGGDVSHEFMLLTPIGEDSIAICTKCGYRANVEAAECVIRAEEKSGRVNESPQTGGSASEPLLELRYTPGMHTMEEVCGALQIPEKRSCKSVVYQKNTEDSLVVVFIRGDLEINEAKLTAYLKSDIRPAAIQPESGLAAGYIGPCGLSVPENGGMEILYDRSLSGAEDFLCGANRTDYHYTGFCMARDMEQAETIPFHDFAKVKEGGICPCCGQPAITIKRGIEVGNIFQLGTKYTEAMNFKYLDQDGIQKYPVMGCYGIGVGRLAASVLEVRRDDYGPVWPMSVAPWQVHLCCLRADDQVAGACADRLYEDLLSRGIEVIYDDRDVRPGVMFSDADLLGVPLRIIVSPRNLKEGICEIVSRDKTVSLREALEDTAGTAERLVREMLRNSENPDF